MKAVILCAGFATRMYPLTKNFPKPLLEVAGKPVLDYLIAQFEKLSHLQEIHIVSNEKFYSHFTEWKRKKFTEKESNHLPCYIHNDGCIDNETRLGAAGDLKLALSHIGEPCKLIVAGGDNIFLFALSHLWDRFLSGKEHLVPALVQTNLEELQRTGVLELDEDDFLVRLHEKPETPPSTYTCPPLYFFQPSMFDQLDTFLKTSKHHDSPGYFIDFLSQHEKIRAARINSSRLDIGNMESYKNADFLLTNKPELAKF